MYSVSHISSATVKHVFEDTPRDHHEKSIDYTEGECDARARYNAAFCERYFGHSALWANRGRLEFATARAVSRSLADSIAGEHPQASRVICRG